MPEAFICDGVRTPIGRYAGGLAKVRTDDLGSLPIKALMKRHPKVDWTALDEVYFGCANQAGEDNRNVARMALERRTTSHCHAPNRRAPEASALTFHRAWSGNIGMHLQSAPASQSRPHKNTRSRSVSTLSLSAGISRRSSP